MLSTMRFTKKTAFLWVTSSLGLVWLLSLFILLKADWRDSVREFILTNDRKILATVVDDLKGDGDLVSVVKVRERGGLFLEFYSLKYTENADRQASRIELLQRLKLSNPIDAFFMFMGKPSNLAIANLDSDPALEILVPSYSWDLSSSLEVVKYRALSGQFELMPSFYLPEELIYDLKRRDP